ncbi:MAG: hypothetical protein KBT31_01535 [Firmicutes bacterium]|nr:hypothetical protein [Candidatus Colimorpha enterica]
MKKNVKKIVIAVLIAVGIIVGLFAVYQAGKLYQLIKFFEVWDQPACDTVIEDEDFDGKILIKEYQKLFHCYAHVYYVTGNNEEIYLYYVDYGESFKNWIEEGFYSYEIKDGIMIITYDKEITINNIHKQENCGEYGDKVVIDGSLKSKIDTEPQ